MAVKNKTPLPEEAAFSNELGKHLSLYGAKAIAYTAFDNMEQRTSYGLVISRGHKRTSLISDMPFHYDPAEEVIDRIWPWLEGRTSSAEAAVLGPRWTTDQRYSD